VEDGPVGNLRGQQSIISFRELARSDFPLLNKWLAAPHVGVWWNERFDLASLEAKYGPAIDGSEPIHVYVIQRDGVPIGWIQWYRWRDFPEQAIQLGADHMSAGIDLAIGEVEMTGRGSGLRSSGSSERTTFSLTVTWVRSSPIRRRPISAQSGRSGRRASQLSILFSSLTAEGAAFGQLRPVSDKRIGVSAVIHGPNVCAAALEVTSSTAQTVAASGRCPS